MALQITYLIGFVTLQYPSIYLVGVSFTIIIVHFTVLIINEYTFGAIDGNACLRAEMQFRTIKEHFGEKIRALLAKKVFLS